MKLLMHMCCAPCATDPIRTILGEGIEVEGFFYNPNIHPVQEYQKRLSNVQQFSTLTNIPIHYKDEFKMALWANFHGEEHQRCTMCYALRLDQAAAFAKEKGFDAYTTTLLVSPYQKHEELQVLGEKFARKHGVDFYYRDFRVGFRQGQEKAKEMGLYRQKYCGCIVSYDQSPFKDKIRWDA